MSCVSLNHSWVFYSQLCIRIYLYLKKNINLPLSSTHLCCSTGSAGKIQYKVLWIFKFHQKTNKNLTHPTHTTHFFFSFLCFFLRQYELAGWYDWHRATIKRPMESSQWQSGKYSTRRVMLGTCWDIDFVLGWSYRTDRPTDRVSAFWHGGKQNCLLVCVQQFRWRLC